MVSSALIIGANRGLGLSLVKHYANQLSPANVFATVRSSVEPGLFPKGVNVIENVDASKKDCGQRVVEGLKGKSVDHVWVVAGLLKGEVCVSVSRDDHDGIPSDGYRSLARRIGTMKSPCIPSAPLRQSSLSKLCKS